MNEDKREIKTRIISAFPGTGKTYYFMNFTQAMGKVLDSDSSKFPKDNFPNNYIGHIKENIGKAEIIFVSSHKDIRNALVDNNIEFTLVYPAIELKSEYIERYKKRGNNEAFVKLLDKNWTEWISQCKDQGFCKSIELQSGEYLSDRI